MTSLEEKLAARAGRLHAACALMRTLDKMEQEGTSQSPDANKLRDALQDLNLTDEEEERLDTYSVELRRKRKNVEDDDAWRKGEDRS